MVESYLEPMAKVVIVSPASNLGTFLSFLNTQKRGRQIGLEYLTPDRVYLEFLVPLEEVINDMSDKIKTMSSGYASLDYVETAAEESDIVRVDIVLAQDKIDCLSFITHRSKARERSLEVIEKLMKTLGQEQFDVIVQALVDNKVIAKDRIRAMRKDVLVKAGKTLGAGDASRKQKLLASQREGKKEMQKSGRVKVSQKSILSVLRRD